MIAKSRPGSALEVVEPLGHRHVARLARSGRGDRRGDGFARCRSSLARCGLWRPQPADRRVAAAGFLRRLRPPREPRRVFFFTSRATAAAPLPSAVSGAASDDSGAALSLLGRGRCRLLRRRRPRPPRRRRGRSPGTWIFGCRGRRWRGRVGLVRGDAVVGASPSAACGLELGRSRRSAAASSSADAVRIGRGASAAASSRRLPPREPRRVFFLGVVGSARRRRPRRRRPRSSSSGATASSAPPDGVEVVLGRRAPARRRRVGDHRLQGLRGRGRRAPARRGACRLLRLALEGDRRRSPCPSTTMLANAWPSSTRPTVTTAFFPTSFAGVGDDDVDAVHLRRHRRRRRGGRPRRASPRAPRPPRATTEAAGRRACPRRGPRGGRCAA